MLEVDSLTISKDASIEERKAEFLHLIREGYSVTYASKSVDRSRATPYLWAEADPEFAKAWADAKESGGDWFEDKLRKGADEGVPSLIVVGLKMRNRFIERQLVQIGRDDLMDRLMELAPGLTPEEIEATIGEAMKLLPAPRGG